MLDLNKVTSLSMGKNAMVAALTAGADYPWGTGSDSGAARE